MASANLYRFLCSARATLETQAANSQRLFDLDHLPAALSRLHPREKQALFLALAAAPWNVGSTHVLECLQAGGVCSASRFLYTVEQRRLRQLAAAAAEFSLLMPPIAADDEDDEPIDCILNDILDSSPTLLGDLVRTNLNCSTTAQAQAISDRLDLAVGRLIRDLHSTSGQAEPAQPSQFKYNRYFDALLRLRRPAVPEAKLSAFRRMHVPYILRLGAEPPASARDALGRLAAWLPHDEAAQRPHLWQLMCDVTPSTVDGCQRLLALAEQGGELEGWRWWLVLWSAALRNAAADHRLVAGVREHLRQAFRRFVRNGSGGHGLCTMLVIARATAHYAGAEFGTYREWFGKTFGEMTYGTGAGAVGVEEFRAVMERLTEVIAAERDGAVLRAHLTVHMAAPAHCYELVRCWKEVTRARVRELEREGGGGDADEVVEVGGEGDEDEVVCLEDSMEM